MSPGAVVVLGELADELAALATARGAQARGALGAARRARRISRSPTACWPPATSARTRRSRSPAPARFLAPRALDRRRRRSARSRARRRPGRLELRAGPPLELRDGAHNPHGMRALVGELDATLGDRRPRVALVALQGDKDGAGDPRSARAARRPRDRDLERRAGRARSRGGRGARACRRGATAEADADIDAGPRAARAAAGPDGAVVICGTLYLLSRLAALEAGEIDYGSLAAPTRAVPALHDRRDDRVFFGVGYVVGKLIL